MKLYKIVNLVSSGVYIGITKGDLKSRFRMHKFQARNGRKTPLYDAMRKYGEENFSIEILKEFEDFKELCDAEIEEIKSARASEVTCYNLCDGGVQNFDYVRRDREKWIANLKTKRVGRKPALGMKHTEDNKKLFSEFGKQRWDKYGRYPEEVIHLPPKEAREKFGISKTHYYRLRQLAKSNDLS